MWQDYLMGVSTGVMSVCLAPQVVRSVRRHHTDIWIGTSATTALCLYAMSVGLFSLQAWFSAVAMLTIAVQWHLLAVIRSMQLKEKP